MYLVLYTVTWMHDSMSETTGYFYERGGGVCQQMQTGFLKHPSVPHTNSHTRIHHHPVFIHSSVF